MLIYELINWLKEQKQDELLVMLEIDGEKRLLRYGYVDTTGSDPAIILTSDILVSSASKDQI